MSTERGVPVGGEEGAVAAKHGGTELGKDRRRGVDIKLYLRDINEAMVAAWEDKEAFGTDAFKDLVQVTHSSPVLKEGPFAQPIIVYNGFGQLCWTTGLYNIESSPAELTE